MTGSAPSDKRCAHQYIRPTHGHTRCNRCGAIEPKPLLRAQGLVGALSEIAAKRKREGGS